MTAKDLKNALLQEAVQGKLVPQIASEENARDLLEEIKKSHTDLQIPTESAGKKKGDLRSKSQIRVTKKEKPLPEITEDEIPFDIPESWCWCRLGELVFNHGQKTPDKEFSYIDIGSIDNEHQKLNEKENIITSDKAPSRARKIVFEGDIIYSTVRPYLHNICIIDKKFSKEPIASTGFAVMASTEVLFNKYLFYYLLSPIFDNYANDTDNAKGVAYPAINDDKLYKGLVPLPPLSEQKRIVAAIEKFMPLIEEYGKKETVLNELNAQIGTLTKKAILQEAVQGKLVPQIPSEGNAKDLLEQIKAQKATLIKEGKIKKEKPLPEISEDEIPFDIPENWCWCRLGEITTIIGDGIHGTPEYDVTGDYYFVNGNNFSNGKIIIKSDTKKVNKTEYEKYRKELNENTVFVSINGTLGNLAFYNNEKIILGKSACYFNLVYREMKYFIFHLLQTKYFFDYADSEATKTTIRNVSLGAMRNLLIPLPPLAEQKRIVAAIEQLLPLCEKLGK